MHTGSTRGCRALRPPSWFLFLTVWSEECIPAWGHFVGLWLPVLLLSWSHCIWGFPGRFLTGLQVLKNQSESGFLWPSHKQTFHFEGLSCVCYLVSPVVTFICKDAGKACACMMTVESDRLAVELLWTAIFKSCQRSLVAPPHAKEKHQFVISWCCKHTVDGVFRFRFPPHVAFCWVSSNQTTFFHMGCGKTANETIYGSLSTMVFFLPLFHKGWICGVHDQ